MLSKDQIDAIYCDTYQYETAVAGPSSIHFARAIEAAARREALNDAAKISDAANAKARRMIADAEREGDSASVTQWQAEAFAHACVSAEIRALIDQPANQLDDINVVDIALNGHIVESADMVSDALPVLPDTYYNAYSDGSEPLYTADQMHDYARAVLQKILDLRAQSAAAMQGKQEGE